MNRPGVFKLYKNKGAVNFLIIPPKFDNNGWVTKPGAILLEAAPGLGKQQWDWDKKLTFAISLTDMCSLIDRDPAKRRIFHEHNEAPKTLEFRPGEGQYAGTYMMQLSEGKGDSRKTVMVPFSDGEYQIVIRLILAAAPLLINWTPNALEYTNQRRSS